ncbi:MAG: methyltransferase [Tannerella sp.]|jgi:tRNA1Val (adenine37-N6)-methyltransferase|nr:methyltransferase [Tannerella sp.]
MPADAFRFKQFLIRQDRCAMKVGTDGVLLGAWAGEGRSRRILDVGTGSGLVALILAQRNPEAEVHALDIDEVAARQAAENASASPFAHRIKVFPCPFAAYAVSTPWKYELIVSNPPYHTEKLKSPNEKRAAARHDEGLPLDELLNGASALLAPGGRLALVLPALREGKLRALGLACGLKIVRRALVATVPTKPPKRILVELSADFSLPCRDEAWAIQAPG